jgi:hypothetical protein
MTSRRIDFEGLRPDDILALPQEEVEALILNGKPISFRAGSAEILAQFSIVGDTLRLDLVHIEGGGEGVLPALVVLANRYARIRGLTAIEWRVDAVNCVRPNQKLRRVLERRGFAIADVENLGRVFYKRDVLCLETPE